MMVRMSSIRPVHRIKHVVDSQTAVAVNTQIPLVLIKGQDAPVIGNVTEVETGSKVNGFFISVEGVASESSTTATPNVYISFYKDNAGTMTPIPNGNAVGASINKKFFIHQEMVMINAVDGGNPRTLFKGVIVIPKGMRRFSAADELVCQLFIPSTGVAMNICTQTHYKEFR